VPRGPDTAAGRRAQRVLDDVGQVEVADDDLDVAGRRGIGDEGVLLLERGDADGRRGERHDLELGALALPLGHSAKSHAFIAAAGDLARRAIG
jgi:hypothetical protein